jgi:hypothetical protein
MGYRSEGRVWLPKKTYNKLPANLIEDLNTNWSKDPYYEDIWYFEDQKWHLPYKDVDTWEDFYNYMITEKFPIDLLVIGEDYAIVFDGSGQKFSYYITIKVH